MTMVLAGALTGPALAEIRAPEIGLTFEYVCSGAYAGTLNWTIVSVENGLVRMDGVRNGSPGWMEKRVNSMGTTLVERRDFGDRNGVRIQSYSQEAFGGIGALTAGSTFAGEVDERHDNAEWRWRYEIEVEQPQSIDNPVLGRLEAIPVNESRKEIDGEYASKATFLVAPTLGMPVGWIFEDGGGRQTCRLEGLRK